MRGANQHLSDEEVEQLTGIATDVAVGALEGAMRHLERCEQCRFRMLSVQDLSGESLQGAGGAKPGNSPCPPEGRWLEVAAGLGTAAERKRCIEHAATCMKCGPLLKEAVEDVGVELTEQEEAKVAALASAQPDWQKNVAQKIATTATPAVQNVEKDVRPSGKFVFWPRWAAAFAALILAAGGAWWAWIQFSTPSVEALLAQAYTEQRTIEMRIAGADYAPMRTKRGTDGQSNIDRPSPLIRAELLIGENLEKHPNDPKWLEARGYADLLDGNYGSAIQSLQQALQTKGDSLQLHTLLASAYFERGVSLERPVDYSNAAEELNWVLKKDPDNMFALFDRAIVYEKLLLPTEAISDWEHYLRIDATGKWSDEARRHLEYLQQELRKRGGSSHPLLSPGEVLGHLAKNKDQGDAEIDGRIEEYLDLVVREWAPMAFARSGASRGEDSTARRAVEAIALLLVSKHGDRWLQDFMTELIRDPTAAEDVRTLADAARMNDGSNRDLARQLAGKAEYEFGKLGIGAGHLWALFEISYADQLTHRVRQCEAEADQMLLPENASYIWLNIQALLESADCKSLGDEKARIQAQRALELSQKYHYGSLELRALTFLGGFYRIMGDSVHAWKCAADGLFKFWSGNYPSQRGYNLYTELDLLAADSQQWPLDVAVIREGISTAADDPDLLARAVEHEHLAQALMAAGDFSDAEKNFDTTQRLFLQSPPGERRRNLETEVQVGLAGLDLLRDLPQSAIGRIEKLRSAVAQIGDKDIEFDFLQTLGLAYLKTGDQRAEETLRTAGALAEESLRANSHEAERFTWSRKVGPIYRAIAQLKLRASPEEAFARWEWYKSSSLRGAHGDLNRRKLAGMSLDVVKLESFDFALPMDTALISYGFFPDGLAIWVYDAHGLSLNWASAGRAEIESLARTFDEHCADLRVDVDTLRREGQKLYDDVFAPIEPLLVERKHLIIEPDGTLGIVPFEALLDHAGTYLGDRWSVSISPGFYYLAASRRWNGISSVSRALVVGINSSPAQRTLAASAIEREAHAIADLFLHHRLLIDGQGTRANVIEGLAESDIFHFAGHAVASPGGVGLSLGDSSLLDVRALNQSVFRNLRLVILSACSTANGENGMFEHEDSLARLFVGAGVPEVVASRWPVDSSITATLMEDFYGQLLNGRSVSEGLHQALMHLRSRERLTHPYYWAAFAVFGRG